MNLSALFQMILVTPLYEVLKFLTLTTGNFGLGVILITIILRALLSPLSLPSIKSQKKMRDIKPEMDKLKALHKNDKVKLQQAQMELYKKHNINVLSGCLPQILQLVVLIVFYNVLSTFVHKATGEGFQINTFFLGLDLSKPDPTRIIPILAAVTQLIMSIMILPGKEKHDLIPNNAKTKKLKDANKKEVDEQEMAETMQRQMVFMMPLMTGFIALSFPSGLGIYWIVTTVFTIIQQWVVAGPGGLIDAVNDIKGKLRRA